MVKMTRKQAMLLVIRGAQKYLTRLKNERDTGPEGVEVYLHPFIKDLEQAIKVIQHG